MPATLHIFLSHNAADAGTARDVQRHLTQAFPERTVVFWNGSLFPQEEYRKQAAAFLEKTTLFIALVSSHYEDNPDTRWEMELAVSTEARRPGLQILLAKARHSAIPPRLRGYPEAPEEGEAIEGAIFARDRQLHRVALMARELVLYPSSGGEMPPATGDAVSFKFEDVQDRLYTFLGRHNLIEVVHLLRLLIHPDRMPEVVYSIEDNYTEIQQQNAGNKLGFQQYLEKLDALRIDLHAVINRLETGILKADWSKLFEEDYFALCPIEREKGEMLKSLFNPTDEIVVPETLNSGAGASGEDALQLSGPQQQDFRRLLLLCQDAFVVRNYARAHALAEQVRTEIDPQSAQLYEYLLAAFVLKESPDRIIDDAVSEGGGGRRFEHVTLYATRFEEYQRALRCPSITGPYNCQAVAEELADALTRRYSQFPDNYVLDTGHFADKPAQHRAIIKKCLETAPRLFRSVSAYQGFLKTAINELCGGGKLHWVRGVYLFQEELRFVPETDIDVESQVLELILLLENEERNEEAANSSRYVYWKPQAIRDELRENLYLRLLSKRRELRARAAAESLRYRRLTDLRCSEVRLIHSYLLGYKIYGDDTASEAESFLRLAIEQLLPNLILPDTPETSAKPEGPPIRWFELDGEGNLASHPDTRTYNFDPLLVVEKIIRDHAGTVGWLKAAPNLKEETYLQFVADTEAELESLQAELAFTDFRRPDDLEARQRLVRCLRRWKIAYHAYPETGQHFLRRILNELIGNGLLDWMYFNPVRLVSHPNSLLLEYDAVAEFQQLLELPTGYEQASVFKMLASNIFQKRILTAYGQLRGGDESRRGQVATLLLETLHVYRDLEENVDYLDFVMRELVEEVKFRWVEIDHKGNWLPYAPSTVDPIALIVQLTGQHPERYPRFEAFHRIAAHRYADQMEIYFRETRERRRDNHRFERGIVIDIIRRMEGIFEFMPQEQFLELPVQELLLDKGRIRWYGLFLGIFPLGENHPDNHWFDFDYKAERVYLKNKLEQRHALLQERLRQMDAL